MKKRLIEEQIIGFLREADAGHPLRCSANVLNRPVESALQSCHRVDCCWRLATNRTMPIQGISF